MSAPIRALPDARSELFLSAADLFSGLTYVFLALAVTGTLQRPRTSADRFVDLLHTEAAATTGAGDHCVARWRAWSPTAPSCTLDLVAVGKASRTIGSVQAACLPDAERPAPEAVEIEGCPGAPTIALECELGAGASLERSARCFALEAAVLQRVRGARPLLPIAAAPGTPRP